MAGTAAVNIHLSRFSQAVRASEGRLGEFALGKYIQSLLDKSRPLTEEQAA